MGSIIDRALDIINDHLKDQTSSFSDPVSLKPMAQGGHVLEDDYPSHYLPGVGRQVMADGGAPIKGFEGRVSSPVPVDEPVAAEGVEAYHGSPHEFEEFDPSKIGTGEGAQVYGHGLYFAGNENIAKYYRDSLTDPDNVSLHFKGRPVDTVWNDEISDRWGDVVKKLPKDHEEDFQTVMGNLSQIKNLSELKHIRASLDRKQNNILDKVVLPELSKPEVGSGHMYEVRLDAHPEEHLLDWDKPLKDQHPNVIAAFNKAVVPIKDDEDKMIHEMYADKAAHEYLGLFDKSKGSQAYKTFADHLGGQDKASEALSKAGIRGIRYLDAGSRGQDEKSGSHNYVIFDPQHIKVKRRYAEGGEVPKSDDEGIVAYAFGNSVPHIDRSISDEYQGSHQSPGPENGAPLWRMHDIYPDDLYYPEGFRYYADFGNPYDREGYQRAISAVNQPSKSVTIYRAVPKDTNIKDINKGDWVTLTRDYAKEHGESALQGKYKILKKDVKARDLFTHGDSIHEFGYHPQPHVSDKEIVSRMSDKEAKDKLEKLSPKARSTLRKALEERMTPAKASGGVTAYHGSPHEFEDRISNGEFPEIEDNAPQEFNSAETSRNQIPALFNHPALENKAGARNIDIGGGKFDRGTQHLLEVRGIKSKVLDPFNRSDEHNAAVAEEFNKNPADMATVANVLNVIKEPHHRLQVIRNAHKYLKDDGDAYFSVYEGDGTGNSRMTRDGWQEHRKIASYLPEIKKVFPSARVVGKAIIASKKVAKAYGGAIYTPELQGDPDDIARRLILWSYAAAPLGRPLARAEGGAIDDPVNKAASIVGAPASAQNAVDIARNLTPMGFYSAAAEAASKFPQKAPIDQIISKIKGQPNVKTAELDNANLKDAFAGQRSVDPQEVARHLQANIPQISEKVYGGKPPVSHPAIEYENDPEYPDEDFPKADSIFTVGPSVSPNGYSKRYWQIAHYDLGRDGHEYNIYDPMGTYHNTFNDLNRATEYINQSINKMEPTQYQDYTIPGGKNYREVVMTLPHEKMQRVGVTSTGHIFTEEELKDPIARRTAEKIGLTMEDRLMPTMVPYKSSHWQGVDNPLAHLRMSDRDNGKTLHLEELQSDWGQEGRKKGFSDNKKFSDEDAQEFKLLNDRYLRRERLTPEEANRLDTLADEHRKYIQGVASAPYVTDTNQWVDLGLKRALLEAAKGGYDKLIWTPGAEQANRYDLSKQIDRLVYNPNAEILMAYKDGKQIINQSAAKNELEGIVGKDVAKNLLASEGQTLPDAGPTKYHILEGQDLAVGGEGMKSFYDKLVPQRLSKLVSQYDKDAKVAPHSHSLKGENGEVKAHAIQITPKLRAAILKGLPAFRSGGDVSQSPIIDRAFKVLSKFSR